MTEFTSTASHFEYKKANVIEKQNKTNIFLNEYNNKIQKKTIFIISEEKLEMIKFTFLGKNASCVHKAFICAVATSLMSV